MVTDLQSSQDYCERITAVKQYIYEHIDEPLHREVLAAIAGFSVSHFHRIFTAQIGENIADYVRRVRLERAGRKLRRRSNSSLVSVPVSSVNSIAGRPLNF